MPIINKIRIVNFAYNNDNRLIPDTTFDLKSQDSLITLRNGGGKSIMAQVIMQPMIPMGSLGHNAKKRTFDKIFRKDQEPCYVLIEWKLDNNAGYMTNGIAFKRFNNFEDEGNKSNIDYYTFIMDKATCDLNITNLKLSTMSGSSLNIKDYYEVRSLIESHGGKVYKSDSEFYKSNLMTYNIYPKEWKSIIAKINGDEGGLLKLFENSITSKDLTENWILKTIKEALESSTNINELSEQTENHIGKARKRIEDRKNREILNKYTNNLEEFKNVVDILGEIDGEIKASKNNIYNLKFTLNEYCKEQEMAVANLDKELFKIEEIIEELKVQSISKSYYKIEDEKNKLIKEIQKIRTDLESKESEFEGKNKVLTSLKVAAIKENCKKAEIELAECEGKIAKLSMEEKDVDLKVRNLGYTINSTYNKKKEGFEKELVSLDEASKKGFREAENLKKSLDKNKEEQKSLLEEAMQLKGKIDHLSKDIEGLLQRVDNNNLFLGTNEVEIENEIEILQKNIDKLSSEILENISKQELLEKEKVSKSKELELEIKKLEGINSKKLLKEMELEKYETTIEDLKNKLNRYNLNFSIKDKEATLSRLRDMTQELDKAINDGLGEKKLREEALEGLSSGGIKVNKRLMAYLEDKSLPYILGSDYIKTSISKEEERRKLLEVVPLLPYALILEKSYIENLKSNLPQEFYESLTLIIEREQLNSIKLEEDNSIVNLGKGMYILSLYNKELVIKEDIEGEKADLKAAITSIEGKILLWKEQLNRINILINNIEELSYNEASEENFKREIADIDSKILELSISIENIKNQIDRDEINLRTLKENSMNLQEKRRKYEGTTAVFEELKVKVIDKKKTYINFERISGDLNVKEDLIHHQDKKLNEINENNREIRYENLRIEEEYKHLKEKQREFIGFEEGTIIEGDLGALISEYHALKQNSISGDLNEYKGKAAQCKAVIKTYNEHLNEFKDDEYEELQYNFSLERKTEKESKVLNEEINTLSSKEAVLKRDIETKDQDISKILLELAPRELKPREEIEKNIEEKKKSVLDKQHIITISISNLKEEIDSLRKIEDRIKDNLWFDIKEYNILKKSYIEEYIKDKSGIYEKENDKLKSLNQKSEKSKENIKNSFIKIKTNFASINQTIDISLKTFEKEIEKQITKELSTLVDKQISLIKITLEKLSTDLEILDTEQNQIISSYLDMAKQYTEELLKIDKNSVLSIEKTRRKMLVIDKLNFDEVSSPRILSNYLKETLNTLINNEGIDESSLSKAINKEFSIENLLTHYCGLNNVVVKFYKVEEHISNSDYKRWEEMLPDNSGGEKFVSFFVLLATLINYSRGNHLKKNSSSMTIIMDNPFAAISSQHLLIPLFEYAKQNNIQLLCFSDHDKVDIIDRFNTIIRLAITPLTNKKEVIEAEAMSNKGARYEEQIDEGYYNYTEQMSLL